jgi:hypothetical protein
MSVLKPRNRLVNFRLTMEEFEQLRTACERQGARSISDFARCAVLGQVDRPVESEAAIGRLDETVERLEQGVGALLQLLGALRSASEQKPEPAGLQQ